MPEAGRLAYLDATGGLAGDMFLGAAIDAGLDADVLRGVIDALGLRGVSLKVERVLRQGISAVHVRVEDSSGHGNGQPGAPDHPPRRLPDVLELLERSDLPPEVVTAAVDAFRELAAVEARIHGCAPEDIHFHEVGAVDSLVDVAGAFAAVRALGLTELYASPVPLGSGTVMTAHGRLPVPAPATLALLQGWPVQPGGPEGEMVTPTGALLLRRLAGEWKPCPPLRPLAVGYGAGTRDDPGRANVTRLLIGEAAPGQEPAPSPANTPLLSGVEDQEVVVLEANLDDLTPELCGHLLEALLAAGAWDATATPLQMKKGRPGWAVTALVPPEAAERAARVFLRESTTLGLRYRRQRRICLERRLVEVTVAGQPVRVKEGLLDGERVNVAPEYEDCRRVAAATGLALKEIYARAQAAARRSDTLSDRSERG